MSEGKVDLGAYRNPPDLDKGRGFLVRALWHLTNAIILQCPMNPSSGLKKFFLKLYGAKIGRGCIFKPGINIKSPWNLEMGSNCWIGEKSWIDSLAKVTMGDNVCLSQDVYICCGNHDWSDPSFSKTVHPVTLEDGVWVATRATILPGVTMKSHSVAAAGAVIAKDTEPYAVYAGNPAVKVKERKIHAAD